MASIAEKGRGAKGKKGVRSEMKSERESDEKFYGERQSALLYNVMVESERQKDRARREAVRIDFIGPIAERTKAVHYRSDIGDASISTNKSFPSRAVTVIKSDAAWFCLFRVRFSRFDSSLYMRTARISMFSLHYARSLRVQSDSRSRSPNKHVHSARLNCVSVVA